MTNDELNPERTMYHLNVKRNLKEGDFMKITYGDQMLGMFVTVRDKFSLTEKYKLVETYFETVKCPHNT